MMIIQSCTLTITENGERMYFASDMPGGYGGMDLYYCEIYGLYKQFFK